MPVAFTLTEFEYILECDKNSPPDKQTRFRLRPLGIKERGEVERTEFAQSGDETRLVSDRIGIALKILQFGLLGWENLADESGPVHFQDVRENGRRIIPTHVLNLITPWVIELANAITERTRLSEDQQKKY